MSYAKEFIESIIDKDTDNIQHYFQEILNSTNFAQDISEIKSILQSQKNHINDKTKLKILVLTCGLELKDVSLVNYMLAKIKGSTKALNENSLFQVMYSSILKPAALTHNQAVISFFFEEYPYLNGVNIAQFKEKAESHKLTLLLPYLSNNQHLDMRSIEDNRGKVLTDSLTKN
ncbi:MAG: hypothetical protein J0G32_01100 [Alphaproteobacteria bacterium]|nr:hypothetical protein [Alphaproteobacteria bacterium]OJV13215.1 MAG: hypothetical protein BGO27_00220 [Alphaproteobacteria bacterium 33-17]